MGRPSRSSEEFHVPTVEDHSKKSTTTASPPSRTKSNQRWMKLRTTVQLSGAIQKNKAQLKREDSFLKRFSTRQIPEPQETLDTGDDDEGDSELTSNGTITGEKRHRRRKKRRKRPPASVINPDGCFFYYWLFLITICVLYNFWILIARHSFPELQERYDTFWLTCDIFTDVVFVLDIVVQFRTGYLEQGLMVYDSKKLAGHYMESNSFLLDLATVFPLDLLQLNLGVKPLLRFPRFFKVHRVYHYYYIVEARTVYPNMLRVVNLIHILLILAHWFGCFYYLLSEAEGFQGDWVYPYRPGEYATLSRKYLASLYWSTLTLTTIGDLPTPETNADKKEADSHIRIPSRGHKSRLLQFHSSWGYIFTIVGYLIGVFIFATIVGQVGNVITNRNANRLEFERLLDGAKSYMRHHKVPGGMKRRVLRWYDYSWSRGRIQGGGDIHSALGLLPDKLKTELALHVNLSVLKKVTIFQECQPEFLHDLVLKMRAFIFTPGDLICRKGEVAREMFIIADGVLEVISESGRVLTKMRAGDFFGEIGILNLDGLNKRTADVRSVGYSELFSLSREDVLAAMKDYPEAQEILQDLGRRRLREAQNMNRAWKNSGSEDESIVERGLCITDDPTTQAVKRRERRTSTSTIVRPELPPPPPPLSIVDKIKADVRGLKDVLKLGTRSKRKRPEDLELQPLTRSMKEQSSTAKGKLRRMPRVNDEASYEEEKPSSPPVIGAGLPLLHRLKLLKEKQELEKIQMSKDLNVQAREGEEKQESLSSSLPLLQRTLMLKQKEEREITEPYFATPIAKSFASTVRTQFQLPSQKIMRIKKKNSLPRSLNTSLIRSNISSKDEIAVSEVKPEFETLTRSSGDLPIECRVETELFQKSDESWLMLKKAVTQPYGIDDSSIFKTFSKEEESDDIAKGTSQENEESRKTSQPGSSIRDSDNLELAQDNKNAQMIDNELDGENKTKSKSKVYRSIDDLSPEYCGLPFVKKLEILNERQKLAEARSYSETSTSSDSGKFGDSYSSSSMDPSTLTRSQSETLPVQVVLRKADGKQSSSLDIDTVQRNENRLSQLQLSSPESNETAERRNLKSILKKLSSGSLIPSVLGSSGDADNSNSQPSTYADIKKLMRAQTIEGYAARHSKLTKSVTFNRVAMHSSSTSDSVTPTSNGVLLPLETQGISKETSSELLGTHQEPESSVRVSTERTSESIVMSTNGNVTETNQPYQAPHASHSLAQVQSKDNPPIYSSEFSMPALVIEHTSNHSYASVDTNQHRFGTMPYVDLFSQIRKIVEGHLDEIEYKYIDFFHNLEAEVRKRDSTISNLKTRIQELECNLLDDARAASDSFDYGDHPFLRAGSTDTILPVSENLLDETDRDDSDLHSRLSSNNGSIDDDAQSEESLDTCEIPRKDFPLIDVECETTTDSEDEGTHKYHFDWEVQMLAEELERRKMSGRKRAVSFDSAQTIDALSHKRRSSYDHQTQESRNRLSSTRSLEIQRRNNAASPRRRSLSINNMQKKVSSSLSTSFRNMKNNLYRTSGEEPLICDLSSTSPIGSSASATTGFIDLSFVTPDSSMSICATATRTKAGVASSPINYFSRNKALSTSVSSTIRMSSSAGTASTIPGAFSSTPDVTRSNARASTGARYRIHSCPVESPAKTRDLSTTLGVLPSNASALSTPSIDTVTMQNIPVPVPQCTLQSPGVFPSSPDILPPFAGHPPLTPSSTSKK